MGKKKKNVSVVGDGRGGKMTFVPNEKGIGGTIVIERGYGETKAERAERLKMGSRAHVFTPKTHKNKGGRQGAKRAAVKDYS